MSLSGKVCIVTGATRGLGKGIALQLGEKGAKVYVTGRTRNPPKGTKVGGSLQDTVSEIEARGGTCVPIQCDHKNDKDIERLFEQVKQENDGQLDILVNNAYSAVHAITSNMRVSFWDQPMSMWDDVNNVGLRNHYICSIYAARLMVPRRKGLIVNISSPGGLRYLFNVPYGIGKEACDRMAADCAFELSKHNVAFVSLWPGAVGTENMISLLDDAIEEAQKQSDDVGPSKNLISARKSKEYFENGETTEFPGQCIAALAADPNIMKKSGKILLTCDLAREYGLQDAPGHVPTELRQLNSILRQYGFKKTAAFVPSFLKLPHWILAVYGSKF